MKVFCGIMFGLCALGVPFGMLLLAATHNPIALIDTIWSGALAYGFYMAGDLNLTSHGS